MRKQHRIPRIIKIEKVSGLTVQCMFNNGESRSLDFAKIFTDWGITAEDVEFPLLDSKEFGKVTLRNHTLSWPNVQTAIADEHGKVEQHPYEIGPDVLYRLSTEAKHLSSGRFGSLIRAARVKAGLTQAQLAERSGTSRFHISRIENNRTDIEVSTLRRIVEAGLGRRMKLSIE